MKKLFLLMLFGFQFSATASVVDAVRERFDNLRSDSEYHQIMWAEVQRAAFTVSGTRNGDFLNCEMSDFVVGFANSWTGKYCSYRVGNTNYMLDISAGNCALLDYVPTEIKVSWYPPQDFKMRTVKLSSRAVKRLAQRTDLFPYGICGSSGRGSENMPGYCAFNPNAPICRQQNYCQMNPGSVTCRNGGSSYCTRNPSSPGCR